MYFDEILLKTEEVEGIEFSCTCAESGISNGQRKSDNASQPALMYSRSKDWCDIDRRRSSGKIRNPGVPKLAINLRLNRGQKI